MDTGVTQLFIIGMVGLFAHLVMFLLPRRYNLLYILTAMYMLVAPLSVAVELPGYVYLKYLRIYLTVLTVFLGFFYYFVYKPRTAGGLFFAFALYYAATGLYSDLPQSAFLYKGLWVASLLSGLMLGYSTRNTHELRRGLRLLLFASATLMLMMMYKLFSDPKALNNMGRFMPWAMNPNRVGQTAAPMAIICTYAVFYEHKKILKLLAAGTLFFLAVTLLYTGSRGALGYAAIGAVILATPLVRRPGMLILVAALAALGGYLVMQFFTIETAQRLDDVNLDTRERIWGIAWDYFSDSPLVGQGWVYQYETRDEGSTQNMHSIYFQTLAETGIFGFILLAITLAAIGFRCLWAWRFTLRTRYQVPTMHFALAVIGAVFAHGLFESGSFTGATVGPVVLGLGLSLLDRIPELYREEVAAGTIVEETYDDDGEPIWDEEPLVDSDVAAAY